MKRGAMGLLQKPEDLPQLPRSLQTEGIRKRFRASILRGQRRHLMHQRTHYSLSRPSTPSRMEIDSDPDEDSGTWEDSLRANLSSPDVQARCTPVDEATNEAKGAAVERGEEYRISLFWALNRAFGARYYPLGLLKLLADMMNFAGPLLLHQLVSFIENRKVCTCTCSESGRERERGRGREGGREREREEEREREILVCINS